jgi:tetratricopeptide (TPR) repeat protein
METDMRHAHSWKSAILAGAILACVAPAAMAQHDASGNADKSASKKPSKSAPMFPNATRVEPKLSASGPDMQEAIDKLIKAVNSQQQDDAAIAQGEKLLGQKGLNNYDRAVVDEVVGYAWLHKKDTAKAIDYLQKSIAENALPNDEHFPLMLQLANVQISAGQTDAGLATLDRVVTETKQDKPEYNALRGQVYYNKKDYADAVPVFQKALDANPQNPDPNVQQMLLSCYFNLKQPERAELIAQDIQRAHPDDKAALLNLASVYQQAGHDDKAAALLDDARKRGMLTQESDYRRLYALYSTLKGHEKDSIATINEGMQKGILQANEEVLTALAEDYYFSGQEEQAIEAYRKADAVSADGEASLNLAKIYHNDKRPAEAKAAAERALKKGVKHPEDARMLLGDSGATTKKPSKKK